MNLPVLRSDWLRWTGQDHVGGFERVDFEVTGLAMQILLLGYQADLTAYQLRRLSLGLRVFCDELYAALPWWWRLWIRWLHVWDRGR